MSLMSHVEAKSTYHMTWPGIYAFGAMYDAKNNNK